MFFTVVTPVVWVGLVIVAATAFMGMNYLVKEESGNLYDGI